MFDLSNNENIKKLINSIDVGCKVFPLYVNINGDLFTILELDQIKQYYPSSFKVGFGLLFNPSDKRSIRIDDLTYFNIIKCFDSFDANRNTNIKYYVIETSENNINKDFIKEMNGYIELLRDKCKTVYDNYRKTLLESILHNDEDWNNE